MKLLTIEKAPRQENEKGADWRARAVCPGYDPELFFPVGTTGPAMEQTRYAKAICNHLCPVRNECLSWALDGRHEYGVFGGMSEDERRVLALRLATTQNTPRRIK